MKIDILGNIKWIFSGIGVIILGWLLNYIWKRIKLTKKTSSINVLDNRKYSATTIKREIEKLPPYLQKKTESTYEGIKIKWKVRFDSIYEKDNICVIMCMYRGDYPWVIFEIELDKYPIFKTIKKGTKFTITGNIISYRSDEFRIDLESIE